MIGPSVGKNLLELADELKNLSEQEIVMEIQNPQKYPQYLVFTELDRRNKMKAKYAQDQQGPPETTPVPVPGFLTPAGALLAVAWAAQLAYALRLLAGAGSPGPLRVPTTAAILFQSLP